MPSRQRPVSWNIPRKPLPTSAQKNARNCASDLGMSFAASLPVQGLPDPQSSSGSWFIVNTDRTREGSSRASLDSLARPDHHLIVSGCSRRESPAQLDGRALSWVDLLHSSYPQPGPVAQLGNAYLRSTVGSRASLLTPKQTFHMYLANVKKTDDPAVQYEFALFLLNTMQDIPDDSSDTEMTPARLQTKAKSILQRLSDRSYPFAQYYLGDGYASGLFSQGKEDYDRAFPLFVAASKHGHVEACYRAALCYEFGWGTRSEAARATQFYRQAASKNHPGAMLRMAQACLAGELGLGRKRYREGVKWMKRASEASDTQYSSAPYELGLLHEKGYGADVFMDVSYAAQLFTRSAELGHAEASYRLGDAYEHGKLHCPRDPGLSIHFYTEAAQRGHPSAMMALCAWYLVGAEPMLERDETEAHEWAKRAAGSGTSAIGSFQIEYEWISRTANLVAQTSRRHSTLWGILPRWGWDANRIQSRPIIGMCEQRTRATHEQSSGWPRSGLRIA